MPLRHDRRRRLLADESVGNSADVDAEPPIRIARAGVDGASSAKPRYADAARADLGRPVHDLFPARYSLLALLTFAFLFAIGLLALVHRWHGALAEVLRPEEIAALSLAGQRNLSHWLASTLLMFSGAIALFIYSLRRHCIEDYHGRYRIWLWTALACCLASVTESTDLGGLAHALARRCAELSGIREQVAFPAAMTVLTVAFAIRMVIEIRRSRLAIAALVASAISFVVGIAVTHGWLLDGSDSLTVAAARCSWLSGYVFVLATFLIYARHVVHEIEGRTTRPLRPKRTKAKSTADEPAGEPVKPQASRPALHVRTDLEPVESSPSSTARSQPAQIRPAAQTVPMDRKENDPRSLSRAERRKLRRAG